MQDLFVDYSQPLFDKLVTEYKKAAKSKSKSQSEAIDKKLRTVRIFISSTFRDFHNERNLLVTKVFPRLRDWCCQHGLYLVECDLRWGIPKDVSGEETLITCLDEIERGRHECNDMNFFLGLLGDRYGWIPGSDEITEYIKERYCWIDDSSVTLMEFLHGVIRTLTPNGLIMMRSSNFIDQLPENYRTDFIEDDPKSIQRLKLFKKFLIKKFASQGLVHFYDPEFDGIAYDKIIEQHRVLMKRLDKFADVVEQYFKNCISNNLLRLLDKQTEIVNNDNFHALMIKCCVKQYTVGHKTFQELFDYLKNIPKNHARTSNSIIMLSGTAGIGKTTILSYCINELERVANSKTFFHSMVSTSSSRYSEEIIDRLLRFLDANISTDTGSMDGKLTVLGNIFTNGVEMSGKDIYYIFIDGLDELCQGSDVGWLPESTHKNIVIVISTLLNHNANSFYFNLKNSTRNICEIPIQPMEKEQLCKIVTGYLINFGKRLDPDQMNALMSFKNSNNPLWLISACEELRIHGDYSSLLKLIWSLPADIVDLNRMIIKRLMNQDSSQLLRCFLTLLITSRAGIWENIVKELLSSVMEYHDPVCHKTWLDIVRQLKGFLLIDSIQLPLIKFRHRVMKESIETELQLDENMKISLHTKMANFFKLTFDSANTLFLHDYFYHLVKSNSRNAIIEFMRNKKSWSLLKQPCTRSKVSMNMRCNNQVVPGHTCDLMMCLFCTNQFGQLSIYSINKNCCFYCGSVVIENDSHSRLSLCLHHQQPMINMNKCALCEKVVLTSQCECVKICQLCKTMTLPNRCGVIVRENDFLYQQQKNAHLHSKLEHLI